MLPPDDDTQPFITRWNTLVRILLVESSVKHIARAAMDFANLDDGASCFPSNERIARETGYSEKTVRFAWSVMRGLGMAERVAGAVPWRGLPDEYRLTIPANWRALPVLGPRASKFACLACGKPFNPQGNCTVNGDPCDEAGSDMVRFDLGRMVFCPAPRESKGRIGVDCRAAWSRWRVNAGGKAWDALREDQWKLLRESRNDDWDPLPVEDPDGPELNAAVPDVTHPGDGSTKVVVPTYVGPQGDNFPGSNTPVVRYVIKPDIYRRWVRDFPVTPLGEDVLSVLSTLEAKGQSATVGRVANVLRLGVDSVAVVIDDLDRGGYLIYGHPAEWILKAKAKAPPKLRTTPDARPCALYRHYDADGVPLYIGISANLEVRGRSHSRESVWVKFAVRVDARWYACREDAAAAEAAAIRRERPVFNRAHNDIPEAQARIAAYLLDHGAG